MGLFGSIGSFFSDAAKAVATGGLSIVAPKLIPKPITQALNVVTKAQFPTSIGGALTTGLAVATKNPALLLPAKVPDPRFLPPTNQKFISQGVQPMALNIGGILGQVGTIFGGSQNPVFSGISNVAGLASQFFPPTTLAAMPASSLAMLPAAGRATAMVARGFFNRFPNLALALQQLRARGISVKRTQLWSILKRFGPEVLVTGGILTAAAVSELMLAGPGRRRMNPGNATALRRSLRRIEAFHRLCVRADTLRRRPGRRSRSSSGATQFVRQG